MARECFRRDFGDVILLQPPANIFSLAFIQSVLALYSGYETEAALVGQGNTHSSVVSSGSVAGTLVKLFSRQSTIPSAHRHGCGQRLLPPHSMGAFSVRPVGGKQHIYFQRSMHFSRGVSIGGCLMWHWLKVWNEFYSVVLIISSVQNIVLSFSYCSIISVGIKRLIQNMLVTWNILRTAQFHGESMEST